MSRLNVQLTEKASSRVLGGLVPLIATNKTPSRDLTLVSTVRTPTEHRRVYAMATSDDVLSVKYVPVEIDGKLELKLVGIGRLQPE